MMDDILTPMEKMDNAIKRANARAVAAEVEAERLREQVAAIAQWAGASDETELMSWVDSGQDGG